MKIIGSIYEHDAIDKWLDVRVKDVGELETALQQYPNDDKIVCWMAVNNLTGQIFDVVNIGKTAHKYNAFYLCDTVALWSHTMLPPNIDDWCDAIFQSSHKIGTELGLGFCWLSDRFNVWLGDMTLHGTPNLAGALAICDATEWAVKNIDDKLNRSFDLYCYLSAILSENNIEWVELIGNAGWGKYAPFINAIRLIGIDAFALQQYLSSKDIYIGIGQSSCAENEDFRQLCNGYNLTPEEAREVIRISFGEYSTYEDVDKLIEGIKAFKEEYV